MPEFKYKAKLILSLGSEEAFRVAIWFSVISISTDTKWTSETAVSRENSLVSGSCHLPRTPHVEIGLLQSPLLAWPGHPVERRSGLSWTWLRAGSFSVSPSVRHLSLHAVSQGCVLVLCFRSEAALGRVSEDWIQFRFLFRSESLWYGSFVALVLLRLVEQVLILAQIWKREKSPPPFFLK